MIIGTQNDIDLDVVYFIMIFGQSNADGRATNVRLANTNWNYSGISLGYPATRTVEPIYSASPEQVFTYNKGYFPGFNTAGNDNGIWQPLTAGTNSSGAAGYFGVELSLSTNIRQHTGKPVYIVKAGFASTYLMYQAALASGPGAWQFTNRYIAMEYYLRRAMRDFRIQNPNKRAVPLCVYWWQGENDASEGRTSAQYKSDFNSMKSYMDNIIKQCFIIESNKSPLWILSKIDFTQSAAETVINTAFDELVFENSDCVSVDPSPYPRRSDLTASERNPGNGGTSDNDHSSYIAMLAMGEIAMQEIIDYGLLGP